MNFVSKLLRGIAFVPAVVLAATVVLIVDRPDRRRTTNYLLGGLAFAVTGLVWYATSWSVILDYLVSFGYGAESARGPERSPLSPAFWTHELRLTVNGSLYLPLAAALVLALVLAAAGSVAARSRAGRRNGLSASIRRALRSDAVVPAIVVAEGYVALSSTRNDGTGFVVPLLPSLIALAAVAALRIPWRAARYGLVTALVAISAFNVVMKADVVEAASERRTARLSLFGPWTLTDGQGWIHRHLVVFAGYRLGPPTRWLPERERGWFTMYDQVAEYVGSLRQREPHVEVAPEEPLLNFSVLRLRASQIGHSQPVFEHLTTGGDDSVAAYAAFLRRERPDVLVTASRDGPQFPPPITNRLVEAAARSLGYGLAGRFPVPDGREVHVWARS